MPLIHVAHHEERYTVEEASAWLQDDAKELFAIYFRVQTIDSRRGWIDTVLQEIGHEKPDSWVDGHVPLDAPRWKYAEMRHHLPHFLR